MKYCTECGAEYQDSATQCSDCERSELVSREEMHRRGRPILEERDGRTFVLAGTAEDPLSAERFTALLDEAGIPVFARARRGGTVDSITGGSSAPWWEMLVPQEHQGRAASLLTEERARMDADADEAGKAAEDEQAQQSQTPPDK